VEKYQNAGVPASKSSAGASPIEPAKHTSQRQGHSKTTFCLIKKNFVNRPAGVLTRPGFRIGGLNESGTWTYLVGTTGGDCGDRPSWPRCCYPRSTAPKLPHKPPSAGTISGSGAQHCISSRRITTISCHRRASPPRWKRILRIRHIKHGTSSYRRK